MSVSDPGRYENMPDVILWKLVPDNGFNIAELWNAIKRGEVAEARLSSDGYIYIATDIDKAIEKYISFLKLDIDDALSEYFYQKRILSDISRKIAEARDMVEKYGNNFFSKFKLLVYDFVILYGD